MFYTIMLALLVVGVIHLCRILGKKFFFYRQLKRFAQHAPAYHQVITRNFTYYNRLDQEEQQKFLFRTFLFRNSHRFHYVEIDEKEEMPILISAVAVQLTLGLDNFLMNYFRDIYVLREDYKYGYYSEPFMGHVDQTGIYLSWENFYRGIRKRAENSHVGLHEMAHALAYVNFVTETEADKHFKKEFHQFSRVARPIFNEMQQGKKNLLGDYAASNYNEFWAVSVEVFFQNPVYFRSELPELYEGLRRLLKQDPLRVQVISTPLEESRGSGRGLSLARVFRYHS